MTQADGEATLDVVRTAARVAFGDGITEDQVVQFHDLVVHGLELKGFEIVRVD